MFSFRPSRLESDEKVDMDIHELCLKLYRTYLVVGGMPEVVKTYLEEQKVIATIDTQAEILMSYERDMTKYADNSLSNRIIAAFDSIPVQLAKENQKFQYKVISKGGTSSIFGEAILWLKNSGIVTQSYKVKAEMPLAMHKDLTAFKLYMSDVGLFVNKARYPLYLIDLSTIPTMISIRKNKKVFTMNMMTYYLFIVKLTIHYMRMEDSEVKNLRRAKNSSI